MCLFQNMCKPDEGCVKHYMDRSRTHTVGFTFPCTCVSGFYCPLEKRGKIKVYEVDHHDDLGPFIADVCKPIPGRNEGYGSDV